MEQQTFWINYNSDLQTFLAVRDWLRLMSIDYGETAMFIWCNMPKDMIGSLLSAMQNSPFGPLPISVHHSDGRHVEYIQA